MRRFKQVDVFTARPFFGNPVAVVIDADGLDTNEMQRIAGWTNLSETTFLLPSDKADYRVRIFTPKMELPFAGHPTLGSAHAALECGFAKAKDGRLRQECGAGVLDLRVEGKALSVKAPPATVQEVAGSSGIAPATRFLRIDVGPVWLVGEMGDAGALGALKPDMAAIAEWTNSLSATGVTLFAPSGEPGCALHVRSFAPAHGVPEDPVCGSGNISVAVYLRHLGRAPKRYVARQGMQLGREGRVEMRLDDGEIWLGGEAVTCVDGALGG